MRYVRHVPASVSKVESDNGGIGLGELVQAEGALVRLLPRLAARERALRRRGVGRVGRVGEGSVVRACGFANTSAEEKNKQIKQQRTNPCVTW